MKVPFFSFEQTNSIIKQEILSGFESFFDSESYIQGESLRSFQAHYAQFIGTKYSIGVGSGLDALVLAMKALGIGKGDEVIIPSNTFIATALAVSHVGATPILVEPSTDSYNLDPLKIEPAIGENTKAIIPVHLYGQACNMTEIMKVASEYRLSVIEDNAQAHGASHRGQMTGSFGIVNATSFYPTKNLGALGDGGAITTNDEKLSIKVRALSNYGSVLKNEHNYIGSNSRLDEIQAGFLLKKLPFISKWNQERVNIAKRYDEMINDEVIKPSVALNSTSVYHLYVIRSKKRDALRNYLKSKGIETLIHYPTPIHLQKAYAHLGFKKGDYPIAEKLSKELLSIPMFVGISEEAIEHVAHCINSFNKH